VAAPFVCPTCVAQGENADIDCDDNIELKPCLWERDPVCMLLVIPPSISMDIPRKIRVRMCTSRDSYKMSKALCDYVKGVCMVAMCDTSACKAELPPEGMLSYFTLATSFSSAEVRSICNRKPLCGMSAGTKSNKSPFT